ncbi:glycosyltransferase family 1 protein [bacterium]|nr:glycosyltransferase family 1 protein [bacterium]NBX98346.1 glycosyltransferase family 1 protein [bacterium]NDC93750.1 glycosyltransferase family 1 protein [bacterium]NDD82891.1 glycosyltransferase family 1 protein [bacterium]NDG28686.1 glycosyltransferase family 1 protein [bacterium]
MLGWELPPHHTGGMGIVCYQLCKKLAQSGADIEFILPYTADFSAIDFMKINPALPNGAKEVLGQSAGSTYSSQYFKYFYSDGSTRGVAMDEHQKNYAEYAAKIALLGSYDIIHAHDWLTFRAGLMAKQMCGKPLIVHIHSTEFDRAGGKNGNPMVREIEYMGLQLADKIIAVSEATKRAIIREYDIDASKIVVAHNAMEFEPHELEDTHSNVFVYLKQMQTSGYKVVLSAGRLTIQKGLSHLVYAMQKVVKHRPKTLLLFVGSGEQQIELMNLAAELGIGANVLFTGHLNGTGKSWRDSFRVADIFVMPSISEPFGLTPFEAITHGTPVLISRQSGVAELLQNSLKVDFWDIDEMANHISCVLDNQDLQDTLIEMGQIELKNLTWDKSVSTLLEEYNKHINVGLQHA